MRRIKKIKELETVKVICNSVSKRCRGCVHSAPHFTYKEQGYPPCSEWSYCNLGWRTNRVKCIPIKGEENGQNG